MKIKKILIFLLCGVTLLSGCGGTGFSTAKVKKQDITPNIVEIGSPGVVSGYFYIVDKNTGVVYLYHVGASHAGMTVMLNIDGTPITAEQLGIKY